MLPLPLTNAEAEYRSPGLAGGAHWPRSWVMVRRRSPELKLEMVICSATLPEWALPLVWAVKLLEPEPPTVQQSGTPLALASVSSDAFLIMSPLGGGGRWAGYGR